MMHADSRFTAEQGEAAFKDFLRRFPSFVATALANDPACPCNSSRNSSVVMLAFGCAHSSPVLQVREGICSRQS